MRSSRYEVVDNVVSDAMCTRIAYPQICEDFCSDKRRKNNSHEDPATMVACIVKRLGRFAADGITVSEVFNEYGVIKGGHDEI